MKIMIDSRLKSKIASKFEYENNVYSIKFKDLEDTFWFKDKNDLYDFLNCQSRERFYDKSLRKGFFTYTNEYNETFKYIVKSKNGNLNLIETILVK